MPLGDQAIEVARSDVAASAAKAAFPVSVASMTWLGFQLSDWVMLVTIVYTVLQIIFLIRDKVLRNKADRT